MSEIRTPAPVMLRRMMIQAKLRVLQVHHPEAHDEVLDLLAIIIDTQQEHGQLKMWQCFTQAVATHLKREDIHRKVSQASPF